MVDKICLVCKSEFSVPKARELTAKYCSRMCSDKKERKRNVAHCRECGSAFFLKKSQQERNKSWGNFCSKSCSSGFRSRASQGSNNPNFKNRKFDADGYRLIVPHGPNFNKKKIKEHAYVAYTTLGIDKTPVGYHIHHKDCNVLNNKSTNLQLISIPDHVWLHKQVGSASLSLIESGGLDIDKLINHTDDFKKLKFLLLSNLENQKEMLKGFDINDIKVINDRITKNINFFDEITEKTRGAGGFGSTGS